MPKKKYKKKQKKNHKLLYVIIIPVIIVSLLFVIKNFSEISNEYFYNFENDDIGDFPEGWVGIARWYEKVEVMQWDKNDGYTGGRVVDVGYWEENVISGIEFNTLFKKAKSGVIEFDIYVENVENRIYIDICQEDMIYNYWDDIAMRIQSRNKVNFNIINSRGIFTEIMPEFELKTWYHFKIKFNVETGWDLKIYKAMSMIPVLSAHYDYFHTPDYFSQLYFATYGLNSQFFIDNVRVSLTELY